MTSNAMIGPWGGPGGTLKEIKVPSQCLNSITIRSGEFIYGLAFSYSDGDGNQHHGGPWGGSGLTHDEFIDGSFSTIQLGPSEFVTQVSGTSGYNSNHNTHVLTSITFITNARSYGPFGRGGGIPFRSPVMSCGSIVGIFARTGNVVDAIGLYVNSEEEPMNKRDLINKIGPWGGNSGTRNDLVVLPRRLISVVVRSGDVIDSLTFTYSDGDGQQHSAGPWEGSGASKDGTFHTILFGPSEFLKQISGTIGRTNVNPDVLTSLFFVTSTGKYGPFGGGAGIPFCSPVQDNGSIIGFFAHVGKGVHAIGLYVGQRTQEDDDGAACATSDLQDDIKELDKTSNAMIGPWGGRGGTLKEIKVPSQCLNSITIRSGEFIYGLAFSYNDGDGNQHHGGPWGGSGLTHDEFIDGSFNTIQLGPSEFVTQVSGTSGYNSNHKTYVLTSITFITNARSYGPFGRGGRIPFRSPVMSCGSIVGIFARTGNVVDAIGLYVNSEEEPMNKRDLINKIGPWGGNSGTRNDLVVLPRRLISVVVRSGDVIDSLTFTYSDGDGQQHSAGPWEGSGASKDGTFHTILFGPSEFLKQISGTIGRTNVNPDVLTSLFFVTSTGKYGPFGGGAGIPFCSPVQDNGSIIGFFAHVGKGVHAIGLYVGQRTQEDDDGAACATSDQQGDIKELDKTSNAMIGPWGGRGGTLKEIKVPSQCLNSITIRSGEFIYGLAFSYNDGDGNQHHGGPWGGSGLTHDEFIDGSFNTIQLGPSEFVTQVSGTSGYNSNHKTYVLTSITFITNARSYGPFGRGGRIPFRSPVMSCGSIVGIFARTGNVVDAIGLYVNSEEEPMNKRDLINKIGPWGGNSGTRNDLVVLPRRLISVVVRSGDVIDSLTFTYSDGDGQQHSAGPWEGSGASKDGTFHTILFGPSEFLKQISGTIGRTNVNPDVLTSLFFVTSTGKYGPFGGGAGIPFCSPVQDNGSIIGFFAHVGKGVHAIGLYVGQRTQEDDDGAACTTSDLQDDIKELDKACITKVGPWGGNKGNPNDIEVAPLHLSSITIRSGEVIYSLAFSYRDEYGKLHHAGPWGACEGISYGNYDTILLRPSEFLTEVSGTVRLSMLLSSAVVSSVTFITNDQQYGPFGEGGGSPFHSPVMSNGCIVGFFAHAERVVDAIGVYMNPERESKIEKVSITKIGPWGGNSGMPNDVDVLPRRLLSVVLHSGKVINSLTFTYSDFSEQQHTVGPWGTGEPVDANFHTILLGGSEILIEVSGTIGKTSEYTDVVTSLSFVTNTGRYGPYGKESGTRFQSPRDSNGTIVGFFANAGDVISSIGVYFNPEREIIIAEVEGGSGISDDSRERVDIKPAYNVLEHILLTGSAEPINLPLALLQDITEDFADKREIGRGGFGIVYKGDLQNGSVAVKRLLNSYTIEEEPFNREATSLISVKHQNIVRFLGYCANTENMAMLHQEPGKSLKHIFAEKRERLLCFEYINNGSLDKYLDDELRGLQWHSRYQIIRGICDGLVYLHQEKGIVHRDMKPANIMLNDRMIPKITDFGISKFLDGATHVVTGKSTGTPGYCPPELIDYGKVSIKSDIYSLGVIIKEIVTGRKDNPDINHVLRRWRYRWNKSSENPPQGYEQVTKCIEIALMCLSESPRRRPYAWDIVSMLNDLESTNENVNIADESPVTGPISPYPWEMLEFDKLELNFPFEINKQILCSLQLTNVTDDYVAFGIEPTGILQYCIEPEKGVLSPRSKCNAKIALQARESAPHATTCKDDFIIVRCAAVNGGLAAEDITKGMFDSSSGKLVDEVMLKVIV